jgi:hypothetical protein
MVASTFTKTVPSGGGAHLTLEESSRLWLVVGVYKWSKIESMYALILAARE